MLRSDGSIWGMSKEANAAFTAAGINVDRIVQTMTVPGHDVAASAGTHDKDGVDSDGNAYSVCVDLSVHHPTPLDDDEVKTVLSTVASHGFFPFYRRPGMDGWPAQDELHIHAVYAGSPMKPECQEQIHSGLRGRNGLVGDGVESFWQPSEEQQDLIRELYLSCNPA